MDFPLQQLLQLLGNAAGPAPAATFPPLQPSAPAAVAPAAAAPAAPASLGTVPALYPDVVEAARSAEVERAAGWRQYTASTVRCDDAVELAPTLDFKASPSDVEEQDTLRRQTMKAVLQTATFEEARSVVSLRLGSYAPAVPLSSALLALLLRRCRESGAFGEAANVYRVLGSDGAGGKVARGGAFKEAALLLAAWAATSPSEAAVRDALSLAGEVVRDLKAAKPPASALSREAAVSVCGAVLDLLGPPAEDVDAFAQKAGLDHTEDLTRLVSDALEQRDAALAGASGGPPPLPARQHSVAVQLLTRCGLSRAALLRGSATDQPGQLPLWVYEDLLCTATNVGSGLDTDGVEALLADAQAGGVAVPAPQLVQLVQSALELPRERLPIARAVWRLHQAVQPVRDAREPAAARLRALYVTLEATLQADPSQGGRNRPLKLDDLWKVWDQCQRSGDDYTATLSAAELGRLTEALVKAAILDSDLERAMGLAYRLRPNGGPAVFSSIVGSFARSGVVPPSRVHRRDWPARRTLQIFRRQPYDDWGMKSLFAGCPGLSAEEKGAGLSKWCRWHADHLAKADAAKKAQGKEDDADSPEAALAMLFGGSSGASHTVSTLLCPEAAAELTADVDYVGVVDAEAAETMAAEEAALRELMKARNSRVRFALPTTALQRLQVTRPHVLSTWLKLYCDSSCQWLWLLPLSVSFDVATDPYRPRRLKRVRSGEVAEQPPALSNDSAAASALASRFDFACGRLSRPADRRVFLVSSSPSAVRAAHSRKILACAPDDLIFQGDGE